MQFIDLNEQQRHIRPELEAAISRVLDHGRYIMGPEIAEVEEQLAAFAGSRHCISCASGTDALLLGLLAYGVGPGDAVITTPFTFFATAEMIALTGATPVFADIDPDTYNLEPIELEKAIEKVRTEGKLNLKGIITVDLFGLPADYDALCPIVEKNGLFMIQDAAQAFGAEYNGKKCPSMGHIGTTSFFPAKPLGCYGDGGAVFTDDDELAGIMKSLRVHGEGIDKYNNVRIGINGRMDSMQAAILLEKLKIYPAEIEQRQDVVDQYSNLLDSRFKLQTIPEGSNSVWAQFCLQADDREEVMARLKEAGIPSVIYYVKPMHLLDVFKNLGYAEGDFPVSEAASKRIFALPMHPYLTSEDIGRICEVMNG